MQTHQLVAHPAHPPIGVTGVEAKVIGADATWLRVRWRVEGAQRLVVPPFAGKGRSDDLWKTTCFELFLRPGEGAQYIELNLSPSERWAAWDLANPREGREDRPFPREPECTMRQGSSFAIFDAAIPRAGLPNEDCAANFCTVIEEQGGALSYWALAHRGDRPDFHDPACFTATLAAPGAA
jgi:hypothetical protein